MPRGMGATALLWLAVLTVALWALVMLLGAI